MFLVALWLAALQAEIELCSSGFITQGGLRDLGDLVCCLTWTVLIHVLQWSQFHGTLHMQTFKRSPCRMCDVSELSGIMMVAAVLVM